MANRNLQENKVELLIDKVLRSLHTKLNPIDKNYFTVFDGSYGSDITTIKKFLEIYPRIKSEKVDNTDKNRVDIHRKGLQDEYIPTEFLFLKCVQGIYIYFNRYFGHVLRVTENLEKDIPEKDNEII